MDDKRFCDYCNQYKGRYERGPFVACNDPECQRKADADYEARKRNQAEAWANMIELAMRKDDKK